MTLFPAGALTRPDTRVAAIACALAALLAIAACGPVDEPIDFQYVVEDVDRDALPAYPLTRLYRYHSDVANVDSLLRRVLNARIALDEVWEPLEDPCDPDDTGPRITAVLAATDARFEEFGFEIGTGIRLCTVRVRRWIISRSVLAQRPHTPALPTEIQR